MIIVSIDCAWFLRSLKMMPIHERPRSARWLAELIEQDPLSTKPCRDCPPACEFLIFSCWMDLVRIQLISMGVEPLILPSRRHNGSVMLEGSLANHYRA